MARTINTDSIVRLQHYLSGTALKLYLSLLDGCDANNIYYRPFGEAIVSSGIGDRTAFRAIAMLERQKFVTPLITRGTGGATVVPYLIHMPERILEDREGAKR